MEQKEKVYLHLKKGRTLIAYEVTLDKIQQI
jgi:hypothetical protein